MVYVFEDGSMCALRHESRTIHKNSSIHYNDFAVMICYEKDGWMYTRGEKEDKDEEEN